VFNLFADDFFPLVEIRRAQMLSGIGGLVRESEDAAHFPAFTVQARVNFRNGDRGGRNVPRAASFCCKATRADWKKRAASPAVEAASISARQLAISLDASRRRAPSASFARRSWRRNANNPPAKQRTSAL
jgi:hypothetical protein